MGENAGRFGEWDRFARVRDDLGESAVVVDDDPRGGRPRAERRDDPLGGRVQ
jgi:hypothetical protein